MRRWSRVILIVAAAGLLLGAGYVGRHFSEAVSAANQRVAGKSELIRTRFGSMEYAVEGQGPPLLMIHGTAGGFDQGLSFSDAIRKRGHTIIAPSRTRSNSFESVIRLAPKRGSPSRSSYGPGNDVVMRIASDLRMFEVAKSITSRRKAARSFGCQWLPSCVRPLTQCHPLARKRFS